MGTIKKHVTGDLTIFKITGSLEPDDVLQALQDLYSHEPTKNILWDLTDATVRQFTLDNVSRLASFVTRFKNTREGGENSHCLSAGSGIRGRQNV